MFDCEHYQHVAKPANELLRQTFDVFDGQPASQQGQLLHIIVNAKEAPKGKLWHVVMSMHLRYI